MSRGRLRYAVSAVLVLSLVGASLAVAASQNPKKHQIARHHGDKNQFETDLIGHNEVPAVHTKGTGHLTLNVSDDQKSISYTLTYSGLNSSPVLFAHVHVGQPNVNGSVSFFLCGGGGMRAIMQEKAAKYMHATLTDAPPDTEAIWFFRLDPR